MSENSHRVVPYGARDKYRAVRNMFDGIAPGYDRMNRLMTMGLDGTWRRAAVEAAAVPAGGEVLDVGTGTGDLSLAFAQAVPGVRVIGVDYAPNMLTRAPAKARHEQLEARISWARADGQQLPFADGTFDAVGSAFVLRNFADLGAAVNEMARVLRPGGRLVALEASPPRGAFWAALLRIQFGVVAPALGAVLAGDSGAYRYLRDSVQGFLTPEEMAGQLHGSGLRPLPSRCFVGGTIVVHIGEKL